jgi:hypothetical protein
MMRYKVKCAKRAPNEIILSNKDITVMADKFGNVLVDTAIKVNAWSDDKDSMQLLVFAKANPKHAKRYDVVFKSDDLMIVELQSTTGKDYIIATSPEDTVHE